MTITSFAPGSITCFFYITRQIISPRTKLSLGVGFTTKQGCNVTIATDTKTTLFYNNKKISIPTVWTMLQNFPKINSLKIIARSDFPLGAGFGMSGALSLALGYAINKLYQLNYTKLQIAKMAYLAEIENNTGVGDIINQYTEKSILLKTYKENAFKTTQLNLDCPILYYRNWKNLSTVNILTSPEMIIKINQSGKNALEETQNLYRTKKLDFKKLIQISRKFTKTCGIEFCPEVLSTITDIEQQGGVASVALLGNTVYANKEFSKSTKININ